MAHSAPHLGENSAPGVRINMPDAGEQTPRTQETDTPDRLGRVQQEMDEAVGTIRVVLSKAMARDAKLTDVQDTAEALADQSKRFETGTKKLRRRWWWTNQWYLAGGTLALCVLVAIVVVPIVILL